MIKLILALVLPLLFLPHQAMADVNFSVQTIESTLPQAKTEQKLILSVCSSQQCRYCKWMDDHVYNDFALSSTINNKLIPIKPTASLNRGEFNKHCKALPTMIFLDESGKVVQKFEGKRTLEEMSAIVNQVLSTNCTAKDEKLDESLGTRKGSVCCDGFVKVVKDTYSVCVEPACIDDSPSGVPFKGELRDTPPCCDDSAEKQVLFGRIGFTKIRCVEQKNLKNINHTGRDSKKPNFLTVLNKKGTGSSAKPY